ncbi:MAG: hypothetical protein EAZ70_07660 [Runella slithyformis]|nr:MAG: hypothetical protein EAY79_07005 [Runella slithyformis]TAF27210.1 MAG: hypothetical protein EAZ70_07660 [Runella slithyformis]TAF45858.1 MAG: hypothetical protein EAZ63_10465 [Runella slithyformis]TAF80685.1 MAG: hypothetical protein EAZ50_08280 [Runella slithyformis]
MANFNPIDRNQFDQLTSRYRNSDSQTVSRLFGEKIRDRFSPLTMTISYSFTNNRKGKKFMDLVFDDDSYWDKLPRNSDTDGFRIYLGIASNGTAVNILSLTEWGVLPNGNRYLLNTSEFYQINMAIDYDEIMNSVAMYEQTGNGSDFFSWHCDPDCP